MSAWFLSALLVGSAGAQVPDDGKAAAKRSYDTLAAQAAAGDKSVDWRALRGRAGPSSSIHTLVTLLS